jgi:hypothetical protein
LQAGAAAVSKAGADVTADNQLKAPFPWFGGKSRAAAEVCAALGDVDTYCEPFAGSLAVLLQRQAVSHEVVNDADGWLVNFWRAMAAAPDDVAEWCNWPVSELDLTARHVWLLNKGPQLKATMEADPHAYDAKAAGWWVWGICNWIQGGWCCGTGPWQVSQTPEGPRLVNRKMPDLFAAKGVKRQMPVLGTANGVNRQMPVLGTANGVKRWFERLAARLRGVKVLCGDFERVLGDSALRVNVTSCGIAGVLLDPPYPAGKQQSAVYAGCPGSSSEPWNRALAWAVENGNRDRLRIIVCGYEGMWSPPAGWTVRLWDNVAGYKRGAGQRQEVLWCSPHCVEPDKRQLELF